MAIYSAVPPPPEYNNATTTANASQEPPSHVAEATAQQGQIDIEAWTISALQSLSVSPIARGTGAPLSIPLDSHSAPKGSVTVQDSRDGLDGPIIPPRRPPSRRDSQKRREALLKGKEGTRARRRWDNARLADVPNVQAPQPFDWEPRPTHPVHHINYAIATYWDRGVRATVEAKRSVATRRKQQQTKTLGDENVAGRVPRELCQRAKKTPAVRTWVRALEEPVRRFLVECNVAVDKPSESDDDSLGDGDTEDEEIVFVGRNGSMRDGWKKAKAERQGKQETGIYLDSLGDEPFKRWITHSISDYYGLDSKSVLVGQPARKVVYIGVKDMKSGHPTSLRSELPRPLWELC